MIPLPVQEPLNCLSPLSLVSSDPQNQQRSRSKVIRFFCQNNLKLTWFWNLKTCQVSSFPRKQESYLGQDWGGGWAHESTPGLRTGGQLDSLYQVIKFQMTESGWQHSRVNWAEMWTYRRGKTNSKLRHSRFYHLMHLNFQFWKNCANQAKRTEDTSMKPWSWWQIGGKARTTKCNLPVQPRNRTGIKDELRRERHRPSFHTMASLFFCAIKESLKRIQKVERRLDLDFCLVQNVSCLI